MALFNSRLLKAVRWTWLPRAVSVARRRWLRVLAWLTRRELDENSILLAFAVAIGVLGALGVIGFYRLIDLAYFAFVEAPGSFLGRDGLLLYRPIFTAAGLALAWHIAHWAGRGREGPNIPTVQVAVARGNGEIETRSALGRTAASAVTLGAGGSAGSEGPVAVLGAALGSVLGRVFHFDASRVKVLVAAGAAAGISAAFNAPLAGAFFALEEILGSLAVGAFPPVVVASVVAAMISRAAFGDHPAFPIPQEYGYTLGWEVFTSFPILGVIAGLTAVLFIRTYFGVPALAHRLKIPRHAQPWIAGAIVGLLVWLSGGTLAGSGHFAVSLDLFGRLTWSTLALLALGKILATSLTLGLGGSGGVFTPSLYIGAVTGGAYGALLARLFPAWGLSPEAYALVGMGVVVAVATSAPITAILIVFEMTNDYEIMLPLMIAVVIGSLVARRFESDSLYSGWLRRRGERLEHGTDHDILARLQVAEAYDPDPQVIGESATIDQLLQHLGAGEQTDFPVVDRDLRLVGMISVADLARVAGESRELAPLLLATDLATPGQSVHLDHSLLDAVRRMGVRGSGALPVVEPGTRRLLGMISRAHVFSLYQRAFARAPNRPSGRDSEA